MFEILRMIFILMTLAAFNMRPAANKSPRYWNMTPIDSIAHRAAERTDSTFSVDVYVARLDSLKESLK